MKHVRLLFVLTGLLCAPHHAHAAGFPVIDIAGLVQLVTDYSEQLQQKLEMINIGDIGSDQLAQLADSYLQDADAYTTLLNQIRDLQAVLSASDWVTLTTAIARADERFTQDLDPLDPTDPAFAPNLRTTLQAYGLAAQDISVTEATLLTDLAVPPSDLNAYLGNSQANEITYLRYQDQIESVLRTRDQRVANQATRADLVTQLQTLSTESELATLQFIAALLIRQMDQTDQLIAEVSRLLQYFRATRARRGRRFRQRPRRRTDPPRRRPHTSTRRLRLHQHR